MPRTPLPTSLPGSLPTALRSPFYAVAGAGDFAAEKLISWSKQAETRLSTLEFDPNALPQQVQRQVGQRWETVSTDVRQLPERAQEVFDTVAADVRQLPERAQSAFDEARSQAEVTYGDLIGRGREVVGRFSSEPRLQAVPTESGAADSGAPQSSATASKKSAAGQSSARKTTTSKSSTTKNAATKKSTSTNTKRS